MIKKFLVTMAVLMFGGDAFGQRVYDATTPVSPEVAALAAIGSHKPVTTLAKEVSAKVIAVVDGDTFWAEIEGKRIKVRTPANDAPVRGKLAILGGGLGQPHGEEATEFLIQKIQGKTVTLRVYLERDIYGRLVADPIVDGRSVSLESIQLGHAWYWQTYGKYLAPADRKAWNAAMKAAKAEGKGLWSPAYPCAVRPSQWRRNPACPSVRNGNAK